MTLEEYQNLPDQVQEMILFNEGRFLDADIKQESVIALYELFSFFVKLEYDTVNYCIASKVAIRRRPF